MMKVSSESAVIENIIRSGRTQEKNQRNFRDNVA